MPEAKEGAYINECIETLITLQETILKIEIYHWGQTRPGPISEHVRSSDLEV